MFAIEIGENEQNQRLDRFLRKYLGNTPLSRIYKIVRKDVKVNGKRQKAEYLLQAGDTLQLYLPAEELPKLRKAPRQVSARKTFRVCYEDENILLAEKPAGLLTHGDRKEKQNHLANQVIDYLIAQGEFNPREAKTFAPAPVNRLDRNTSGLVLFGKTYPALQSFNAMMRERGAIHKRYLALTEGTIPERTVLEGYMQKDEDKNRVQVRRKTADRTKPTEAAPASPGSMSPGSMSPDIEGKYMHTVVQPLAYGNYHGQPCTLASVEISTGRTHQIRAQLAEAGWPIWGDPKYGTASGNRAMAELGVHRQLLHARELRMDHMVEEYAYLNGKSFEAKLPKDFQHAVDVIFGELPEE